MARTGDALAIEPLSELFCGGWSGGGAEGSPQKATGESAAAGANRIFIVNTIRGHARFKFGTLCNSEQLFIYIRDKLKPKP